MPNPKQLSFYSMFSAYGDDLDAIHARLGQLGRAGLSPEMAEPMLDAIVLLTAPPVHLAPEEKAEALRIMVHTMEHKRSTQQMLESMSLMPSLQNFASAAYAGLLAAVMRDEAKSAMALLRAAAEIPEHVEDAKVMEDLPALLARFTAHIGMPEPTPEQRAAISSVFAANAMTVDDTQAGDSVFQVLLDLAAEPALRGFVSHAYAGFFARLTQIRMRPGQKEDDQPEDNYLDRAWGGGFVAEAASDNISLVQLVQNVKDARAAIEVEGAHDPEGDDDGLDDLDFLPPAAPRPGFDAPRG